jgi:hypothetical protein
LSKAYPIGIYLDTNAIVKSIEDTPTNSIYRPAYEVLREKTGQKKCVCVTTEFALMESVDQLKENEYYKREMAAGLLAGSIRRKTHGMRLEDSEIESAFNTIRKWVKDNSDVVSVEPLEFTSAFGGSMLGLPYAISEGSCIGAPDCIHLASALMLKCDVILTADTLLRKEVCRRRGDRRPDT